MRRLLPRRSCTASSTLVWHPVNRAVRAGCTEARSQSSGLFYLQLHHREHRAAERAVRVGERLGELEVVVALGTDDLGGASGAGQGVGEVLRLALELGRLERAVDDRDRRADAVEMTLRRE